MALRNRRRPPPSHVTCFDSPSHGSDPARRGRSTNQRFYNALCLTSPLTARRLQRTARLIALRAKRQVAHQPPAPAKSFRQDRRRAPPLPPLAGAAILLRLRMAPLRLPIDRFSSAKNHSRLGLSRRASSSKSWISDCCCALKVMTPSVGRFSFGKSSQCSMRLFASAARAKASIRLVRLLPRS